MVLSRSQQLLTGSGAVADQLAKIEADVIEYATLARYSSVLKLNELSYAELTSYANHLSQERSQVAAAIRVSTAQLSQLNQLRLDLTPSADRLSTSAAADLNQRLGLAEAAIQINLKNLQLKSRENATRTKAVTSALSRQARHDNSGASSGLDKLRQAIEAIDQLAATWYAKLK